MGSTPKFPSRMGGFSNTIQRVCPHVRRRAKERLGRIFQVYPRNTESSALYGDKAWMGRFIEKPFEISVIGQDLYEDFAELRAERIATDRDILDWSSELNIKWLDSSFEYTSNVDGKTRGVPTWVLVMQMFNHQTHHRGQVTTLIKQLGHEPGITDLPWLPEFEPKESE